MKKRVPSLTSNYALQVEANSYLVDKTEYIKVLEQLSHDYVFYLRPRRFGKSLLLSMLEHYYGLEYSEKFELLFGEYYIGKPENSTPLRNSFHIMLFNFSGISSQNEEEVQFSFNRAVYKTIADFVSRYLNGYENLLTPLLNEKSAGDMVKFFMEAIKIRGFKGKIYVMIDEYDHFTNELYSFNRNFFIDVVSQNGWVRKFYETIKIYMGEGIITKFFATGVTPVTLDSMTSGFNVAKNLTLDEAFHSMGGFEQSEVVSMMRAVLDDKKYSPEVLISDLMQWYNGSRFSPDAKEKLYNPQLIVSFLSEFSRNYTYPREMSDVNVNSDYKKILNILAPLNNEESEYIINEILVNEKISEGLTLQFNFERTYTRTDAVSLLFYNGLLTIEDTRFELQTYSIPNYVIKQLYWDFFRNKLNSETRISFDMKETGEIIWELATQGSPERLIEYVKKVMRNLSFRDLENFRESNLKMIFMTILMGTNAYYTKSEVELSTGYADILMRRTRQNTGKYNHLFELKYVKEGQKKNLENIKAAGTEQVRKYRNSLTPDERENLLCWLVLFHDKSEAEIIRVS